MREPAYPVGRLHLTGLTKKVKYKQMQRTIFTSLYIMVISVSPALAQTTKMSNGAYMNSVDLAVNKTLYDCEFQIKLKKNIKGVDLYKITPVDLLIGNKIMKNQVWAIYKNGVFYINAFRLGMDKKGFIKIDKLGKYSYFKGLPILSLAERDKVKKSGVNYGLIGAAVSSAQVAEQNKGKVHYILNLKTGITNLLTRDHLLRLLKPHPSLLKAYEAEEKNRTLEVVLKYLDLINEEEKY